MCDVKQAGIPAVREWRTTESEKGVLRVMCLSGFINIIYPKDKHTSHIFKTESRFANWRRNP